MSQIYPELLSHNDHHSTPGFPEAKGHVRLQTAVDMCDLGYTDQRCQDNWPSFHHYCGGSMKLESELVRRAKFQEAERSKHTTQKFTPHQHYD